MCDESTPAASTPTTRSRVYHALVSLAASTGRPPTVREIGVACGITSTGNTSYHLAMLVELGLARNLGGARGYVAAGRP